MADVIDLNRRKDQDQTKEQARQKGRHRRKAQAVAASLSCGLCPRRCAMCGQGIESFQPPLSRIPYPLCESCREEARDFLRREEGLDDEQFWHTEGWSRMWRNWLAYMKSLDDFRKSAEFTKLMRDFID